MMMNARFEGTYKFEEVEREVFGAMGVPQNTMIYHLFIDFKGTLTFDIDKKIETIKINERKLFAENKVKSWMHKNALDRFYKGEVDKMIKETIINAIKGFKAKKEMDLVEEQYKALMSGTTKYSIELTLRNKDFE
jgi:hypothetical protein